MIQIRLQGVRNRKGPVFNKDFYDRIRDFIMDCITSHAGRSIPFSELLDHAEKFWTKKPAGLLPWHIMQVKIDLQERGIIKAAIGRDRTQVISMRRKNNRKRPA